MPILIRWEPDRTMTLQLAGTLDTACVADLERALESARHEHTRVVLDVNGPDDVEGWVHRESEPAER